MKPVHFRKSPRLPLSKAIVFLLFVIVLTACGANPVTSSSRTGSTANKLVKTASAVPPVSPTAMQSASLTVLNLNAAKITIDAASLRIQSELGFQCPYNVLEDQLVLASDRTTYSQDEIAQMSTYLSKRTEPPPPTLRWALGASMDPIPGTLGSTSSPFFPLLCGGELTLTNTGST